MNAWHSFNALAACECCQSL